MSSPVLPVAAISDLLALKMSSNDFHCDMGGKLEEGPWYQVKPIMDCGLSMDVNGVCRDGSCCCCYLVSQADFINFCEDSHFGKSDVPERPKTPLKPKVSGAE
jgi:hypothetical protein